MIKGFNGWHIVKQELDTTKKSPLFKEREIWWCSLGMNIGYEIYGKGEKFWRPVLILDKHNRHTFFGLPLTSTVEPDNPYFSPIHFRERDGSVLLSQGRTLSSKRLANRMGSLPENDFEQIRHAFGSLYIKK